MTRTGYPGESMDVSNGTAALGIAVALGEIAMPDGQPHISPLRGLRNRDSRGAHRLVRQRR